LIVLTSVLVSCQTTKNKDKEIVVIVPELYFPSFPSPDGKVVPLDKDGNIVTDPGVMITDVKISFEYFKRIVEYKAQIDELKARYEVYKK